MKTLNEQYYSLRLMLEAAVPSPAVFAVGCATEKDESENVACNLARAFADAGYKTVVVDPDGGDVFHAKYGMKVPITADLSSMSAGATNGTIKNLSALALTGKVLRTSTSARKMQDAIADLRLRFDIIIVNAGIMTSKPEALQFARAADGVILSFRFGRKAQREDRDLTEMLERVGATLLGVVGIVGDGDRRPEPAFRAPRSEDSTPATPAPSAVRGFSAPLPVVPVVQATKEAV
jgi:Mrp family chromosome partitioning ATPase